MFGDQIAIVQIVKGFMFNDEDHARKQIECRPDIGSVAQLVQLLA